MFCYALLCPSPLPKMAIHAPAEEEDEGEEELEGEEQEAAGDADDEDDERRRDQDGDHRDTSFDTNVSQPPAEGMGEEGRAERLELLARGGDGGAGFRLTAQQGIETADDFALLGEGRKWNRIFLENHL